MKNFSASDKAALKKWQAEARAIRSATTINIDESQTEKVKRIDKLLSDPIAFAKYYFPHYCTSEFGDFQIEAINKVVDNPIIYAALEWSRDHAKSSTISPMAVLYLAMKEKDVNLLMVSYNETNAVDLLKPIKLEFEFNLRIINDFGVQKSIDQWESKKFVTTSGCSFRAIGSGQSPRGSKEKEVRPNIIVIDDIDEDEMLRNPKRLDQTWNWVSEALYPVFDISGKKRFIVINNRIAKKSILTKAIEKADFHSRVDAIKKAKTKLEKNVLEENLRTCKKLLKKEQDDKKMHIIQQAINYLNDGFIPTWHQRFTMLQIFYIRDKVGSRSFDKEYCNNPSAEGKVFKAEWLRDKKLPALSAYKNLLIAYLDPGFKKSATSDGKAWWLVGLHNGEYHIIKGFCSKASVNEMIQWGYELDKYIKSRSGTAMMKMEEVFLQDLLYKDFQQVAEKKYPLALSGDKRKKPDKDARIEATSGYFERGVVYFNEEEKDNHHMIALKEQYLSFEVGVKTPKDGIDSVEGAIYLLNQAIQLSEDILFGKPYINKNRV